MMRGLSLPAAMHGPRAPSADTRSEVQQDLQLHRELWRAPPSIFRLPGFPIASFPRVTPMGTRRAGQ
eukprot:7656924-Pyramimonas_sp.AAC.1